MGSVFSGILHGRQARIRLSVNDLSNGRTHTVTIGEPSKYTLSMLGDDIRNKLDNKNRKFILKYKTKLLSVESEPNSLVTDALGISENTGGEGVAMMLEYTNVNPSQHSSALNNWTLHIKTLTGNVINIETANPQELCVLGLKLLIQDEISLKPEQMRLVMANKELEDGKPDTPSLIRDIPDMVNGSTIQLVLK